MSVAYPVFPRRRRRRPMATRLPSLEQQLHRIDTLAALAVVLWFASFMLLGLVIV